MCENEKAVNAKKASEILGCSVKTVYEALKTGNIQGEKISGRWRIDYNYLLMLIHEHHQATFHSHDVNQLG